MVLTKPLIQGKYIIGSNSVVGDPRRKWEDRLFSGEIQRRDDEALLVGVVADGVGSSDFGARGAQLAIDTFTRSLERSHGDDIPSILVKAIEEANFEVYVENQGQDGDGLTTLVAAIIYRDRCYIGNVGDSRAYWVQVGGKGKLLQLTRDHTYYNVYGGSPNSREAGVLVNIIGRKVEVQVDIGFYLKGDNSEQAHKLGMIGLPLQVGDTILLCTDGLIKTDYKNNRYILDTEIVNALQTEYNPDLAAIKMVSIAEGRRPDDNISVVTIQNISNELRKEIYERSSERSRVNSRNRFLLQFTLMLFVIITIGVISYFIIRIFFQK